jgi:hypothetical protein
LGTNYSIQYLAHTQINTGKWDDCISKAANGTIYGYSWYLDAMAKNWDALVLGDYEMVMPLTWNKKYGFSYLYQPAFTATGGVYGNNVNIEVVNAFLQAIPAKFKLIEISLNTGNSFNENSIPDSVNRVNYVLPLQETYATIRKQYRDNHKRNIQKAIQYGCTLQQDISIDDIIVLSKDSLQHLLPPMEEDYERLKKVYQYLLSHKKTASYGVYDKQGQLMASCIFFFSHNRAYYILVGNNPLSKTIGASHFLIDSFIQEYAGTGLTLDFEGSDIRSLAFFYNGFGATIEYYPALLINRLPFYLKWLKK